MFTTDSQFKPKQQRTYLYPEGVCPTSPYKILIFPEFLGIADSNRETFFQHFLLPKKIPRKYDPVHE